ncbi:hypothetical protein DEQ67_019330 (plasmid) [Haloferax sp. Atlit-48N]|uniref:Uncharacterized protein n=1 Tax=Haloferax sp. Atlit-48N TaxID=2077198 RepID=A0ACD5I491_9EURY|nr:hypothetical protein [Haloferax sp. BAB-2207]
MGRGDPRGGAFDRRDPLAGRDRVPLRLDARGRRRHGLRRRRRHLRPGAGYGRRDGALAREDERPNRL